MRNKINTLKRKLVRIDVLELTSVFPLAIRDCTVPQNHRNRICRATVVNHEDRLARAMCFERKQREVERRR